MNRQRLFLVKIRHSAQKKLHWTANWSGATATKTSAGKVLVEATLAATKQAGKTYLQAALTKFLLRWAIFISFYLSLLYFIPSLKYLSLIFCLIISYSLFNIYQQSKLLRQKVKEIETLIKEIKNT